MSVIMRKKQEPRLRRINSETKIQSLTRSSFPRMRRINSENNSNVLLRSTSMGTELYQSDPPPLSADAMTKGDKSLIAYGVKYFEEKTDKPKLLKVLPRPRIHSNHKSNKSIPDLESGEDSVDSGCGSSTSSGDASSPTSSETSELSVASEADSAIEDDAWLHYDRYPFENIAMSGGGAKGYAYIGALKAMEDAGVFPNIKRFVGTSAGAVISGMLIVGATSQEVADFFNCDVKKLFQDKISAVQCLLLPRLLTKYGINTGQTFYDAYGDFLASRCGDPDITFEAVYRIYRKELCVTVTNLSRMCSEYCTRQTTPDLPLRKAIRISMAFPGVYESLKIDLFGTGTESLYIDGGALENFPVQYFDDLDPVTKQPIFNEKTVGLYLMSEDQFSHKIWQETFQAPMTSFPTYLPDTKLAKDRLKEEMKRRRKRDKKFDAAEYIESLKKDPYIFDENKTCMRHFDITNKEQIDIKGPKHFFRAMLSTLLLSQKHVLVKPEDLRRTIGINCGYIDTKDTGIDPGDREFMIRQGYEQTREFLQRFVASKLGRRRSVVKPMMGRQHPKFSEEQQQQLLQQKILLQQQRHESPSDSPTEHLPSSRSEHLLPSPTERLPPIQESLSSNQVVFSISDSPSTEKRTPAPRPSSLVSLQSNAESETSYQSVVDLSDSVFTKL